MDIDCLDEKKDDIKESEWQKLELEGDADDKEGASSIASGLAGLGLGALGALDISFATRKTKDGKIRVRVHTSSGSSASPSSPSASSPASQPRPSASAATTSTSDKASSTSVTDVADDKTQPSATDASSSADKPQSMLTPLAISYADSDPLGPFLGIPDSSSPSPSSPSFVPPASVSANAGSFDLGLSPMDMEMGLGMGMGLGLGLDAPFELAATTQKRVIDGAERKRVRIALCGMPSAGGEGGEWEVEIR